MIIDDILVRHRDVISRYFRGEIIDYAIGIKYAYCIVQEENRKAMGVAYSPYLDIRISGIADIPRIPRIFEKFPESGVTNRTIFLACINAISQYLMWHRNMGRGRIIYTNLIDLITSRIEQSDNVVVIGNMVPLVRRIREKMVRIHVFERDPLLRTGNAMPDYFEYRYLEHADIVIITGAALLNDTIDLILRYTPKSATKIIVGPTAQLLPEILLEWFDIVASLRIDNMEETVSIIKRGGGRWDFSKYCTDYIAVRPQYLTT